MDLTEAPEHLLVPGGSYIGLEFGQMFRRYGRWQTLAGSHLLLAVGRTPNSAQLNLAAAGIETEWRLEIGDWRLPISSSQSKAETVDFLLSLPSLLFSQGPFWSV